MASSRTDVLNSMNEELKGKLEETPPSQNQPKTSAVQLDNQFVDTGFENEVYHI